MPTTATVEPRGWAPPEVLAAPVDLRRWSERSRAAGLVVGLVPTMGALHQGHRSLLRRARSECDRVAATIFVNPPQFGTDDDLDRYPRMPVDDLAMLREERADAVLMPAAEVMYPSGHATSVRVASALTTTLEGAARPGHLDGVALVITKLLAAARPDRLYLGEKDAQQCAVIRRLVADLDLGVEVISCPTVRDDQGLAMSSRNARLSAAERDQALAIPAALEQIHGLLAAGVTETTELLDAARRRLAGAPALTVDYIAIVDPDTFEELPRVAPGSRLVVAARVGSTRLLDATTLAAPAVDAGRASGRPGPGGSRCSESS